MTQQEVSPQSVVEDQGFWAPRIEAFKNRGSDERGAFMLPSAAAGSGKMAAKLGRQGRKHPWVLFAGAMTGIGAILAVSLPHGETYATADLDESETSASIETIAWDPTQEIKVTDVVFDAKLDARDIPVDIVVEKCIWLTSRCADIYLLDPKVNKELSGLVQEAITIPLGAINQEPNAETNKLDLEIDLSKVKAEIFFPGAGPTIRDYTIDDGKQNFDDQSGFRDSVTSVAGSVAEIANHNTLANTATQINGDINHDMTLRALDFIGECNREDAFINTLTPIAIEGVRGVVKKFGRESEIGEITIKSALSDKQLIKVDTGQEAEEISGKTYGQSSYRLEAGKFKLDKKSCVPTKEMVVDLPE